MTDQMVGAVPGEVLGTLADIMLKLKNGGLTADELKLFAKRENPFQPVVKSAEVPKPEPLWRKISEALIVVNLGHAPRLPFKSATVEKHIGNDWVEVHKRSDGLYVSGMKVVLHLVKRQMNGGLIKGYELREELTDKSVLNANILDALYDNVHLIPEDWKRDENRVRFIFFWGTIYNALKSKHLFVRSLYFDVAAWGRRYDWIGHDWHDSHPAALLAS